MYSNILKYIPKSHKANILYKRNDPTTNICTIYLHTSKSFHRQNLQPNSKDQYTQKNINSFGIPLVNRSLEKVLFGASGSIKSQDDKVAQQKLQTAKDHLAAFNINTEPDALNKDGWNDNEFRMPKLKGPDVERHFYEISQEIVSPYLNLSEKFSCMKHSWPKVPKHWCDKTSGWSRYNEDGSVISVDAPLEDCFAFDVEVCVLEGHHPVIATALSHKAWYSWISPHLLNGTQPDKDGLCASDLINVDGKSNRERLIIGHNVSYDRQRCAEQYNILPSKTRFMDTMSLHIAVSGMTSGQRTVKAMFSGDTDVVSSEHNDSEITRPQWVSETSKNSLNDVYQLYCKGSQPLKKFKRDVFVTGSSKEILNDLQALMTYCSMDVLATSKVYAVIFPMFRERCPHPATVAGMLEMTLAYLPTNSNWQRFLRQSDDAADELVEETGRVLAQQAKESCQLLAKEAYKRDLWMWDQDWQTQDLKVKKPKNNKKTRKTPEKNPCEKNPTEVKDWSFETLHKYFQPLLDTKQDLFKVQPACPGYPGWYNDLCNKSKQNEFNEPADLTAGKKIVPKLLRLTWMGYPIHRHEVEKWGYLKPDNQISDVDDAFEDSDSQNFSFVSLNNFLNESNVISNDKRKRDELDNVYDAPIGYPPQGKKKVKKELDEEGIRLPEAPACIFVRLPHKDGKDNRVGSPLAKDFLDKVRDGILATQSGQLAEKVLSAAKCISYWKSSQERIKTQMVVKLTLNCDGNEKTEDISAIVPQMVPAGTLTRRAVERTWLTASNAKPDRIGSELKSLIQAPPGFVFVGADVDSQELWIAAVIGDAEFTGHHGSTALGWMTLQGSKSKGTDMHSAVAKSIGVTRDRAKILNYGRIYGAGVPFAKQLLMQFNPLLNEEKASKLANKMYLETKGERTYVLNNLGAFCYVLSLSDSAAAATKDYSAYKGTVVSRKEMSKLVQIKRKLDVYVTFNDSPTKDPLSFELNDSGQMVAYDMGIDSDLTEQHPEDDFKKFNLTKHDITKVEQQAARIKGLKEFLNCVGSAPKGKSQREDAQSFSVATKLLSKKTIWRGGSESHTFNRLEEIALNWNAMTPVLGCRISRVLESSKVGGDYLPSRINWVVQSSAVDYLHLLLVAMQWLMGKDCYDIEGRFIISIHDEVRYMVKHEDRYKAALALQTANLLVRAMFCSRLGMNGLPRDVAFFSSIDVDQVMRKEPDMECITPSNPQGLSHGYGIKPGEGLTIQDVLLATQQ